MITAQLIIYSERTDQPIRMKSIGPYVFLIINLFILINVKSDCLQLETKTIVVIGQLKNVVLWMGSIDDA